MDAVEEELVRLEQLGFFEPTSYSPWASPIVAVRKPNGSVRICADFSTCLNAALEDNHHPLPLPENVFTILNCGNFFAKLDLSEAYLQIEFEHKS